MKSYSQSSLPQASAHGSGAQPSAGLPGDPIPAANRRSRLMPLLIGLFFMLGLGFLLVREVLVPHVDVVRPHLVAALERGLGRPVVIEALAIDWRGVRPRLRINGLRILENDQSAALALERVDATLAWSSFGRGAIHFHRLVVHAPDLALRRDPEGRFFVAGLHVDPQAPGSGLRNWLLAQREVVVRDARLTWLDQLRGAPPLSVHAVQLRLSAAGGRHRFAGQARLPEGLGGRVELKGDMVSLDPARPEAWAGQVYAAVEDVDLGGGAPWLDLPLSLRGSASARAWIDVDFGQLGGGVADFALAGVEFGRNEAGEPLRLEDASARVSLRRGGGGTWEWSFGEAEVGQVGHARVGPFNASVVVGRASSDAGGGWVANEVGVQAARLDLAALAALAEGLPPAWLPADQRQRLVAMGPSGQLQELDAKWRGSSLDGRPAWAVNAHFSGLRLDAVDRLPGVEGMSGEIRGDALRGRFIVRGRDAALALPAVFPEPVIALSSLFVEGGWTHGADGTDLTVDALRFENEDAAGSASGVYRSGVGRRGGIDLAARLTRAEGMAVARYLPWVAGAGVRAWLGDALQGGFVPEARLRLMGPLDAFPFENGEGVFQVTARVADARLRFDPAWPPIEAIHGELRFEGPGMRILADNARIMNVDLTEVTARIPDLDAPEGALMTLGGQARGASSAFLAFVAGSPVSGYLGGFTDGMHADGDGHLSLALEMPFRTPERTRVEGEYRFSGNRIVVLEDLPALTAASGRVRFTEQRMSLRDARARFLDAPLTLGAETVQGEGLRLRVDGGFNVRALSAFAGFESLPLMEHLSGGAPLTAEIIFATGGADVRIDSDLQGLSSSLPYPLNKRAAQSWPLTARVRVDDGGRRQHLRLGLADDFTLELSRSRDASGWRIERGGVAMFAPLETVEGGIMFSGRFGELDLDRWRALISAAEDAEGVDDARAGGVVGRALRAVDLSAGRLHLGGIVLDDLELGLLADADGQGWRGRITSTQADGSFEWGSADAGVLHARFAHLAIGEAPDAEHAAPSSYVITDLPRRLPDLDVVAERFLLRGRELGGLLLDARNEAGLWTLERLEVGDAQGMLVGEGRWRAGVEPLTELRFRLDGDDIEDVLTRLGYPESVAGGTMSMQGEVSWRGAPTRIHHPSLAGEVRIEARNGRFRQLEPGVGRLLGVLSLQALPRRLSLDFRDVFSEGFAFDQISGNVSIESGVLLTEDLHIAGPAAKIWVGGVTSLVDETQDLLVVVQPTLTESVAVGAAAGMINPVAGVLAYLAQRVLSDPIERMFAYSYAITGTWSDPKVEKLSGGARQGEGGG